MKILKKILSLKMADEIEDICLRKIRRLINKVKNDSSYGEVKYIQKKQKIKEQI
jgi:hypothetical protein